MRWGFQAAKDAGEATSEFDPKEAAVVTTALVDGLLLHMLTDPTGLADDGDADARRPPAAVCVPR